MRNCGYIKEQFEKIHTEVKECDGSNLFPQGSEKNYTVCVWYAHILTKREKLSNCGKMVKKKKKVDPGHMVVLYTILETFL